MGKQQTGREGRAVNLYLDEGTVEALEHIRPQSKSEAVRFAAGIVSGLDAKTLELASKIGAGSISEGIKKAISQFKGAM